MLLKREAVLKNMNKGIDSIINKNDEISKLLKDEPEIDRMMSQISVSYKFNETRHIVGLMLTVYCIYNAMKEKIEEKRELCRNN